MSSQPAQELQRKQDELLARLRALDSLVVALSGGADSAYLAWAAHQALGERSITVTALSSSFSAHDRQEVEHFVHETGIRHIFVETREFENPLYVANNPDRCYYCKGELFTSWRRSPVRAAFAPWPTASTPTMWATFVRDTARHPNINADSPARRATA